MKVLASRVRKFGMVLVLEVEGSNNNSLYENKGEGDKGGEI